MKLTTTKKVIEEAKGTYEFSIEMIDTVLKAEQNILLQERNLLLEEQNELLKRQLESNRSQNDILSVISDCLQ